MKKYIQESASNALKNRKESYILSGQIPVYILNKLSPNLDLSNIIDSLEESIPESILSLIEGIYIGDFKELKDRNIQAMFKDGVIYLSSFKDALNASEELIVGNICHELAHAVEDNYGHELYTDDRIESEYNGKKKKIFDLLAHQGYQFPKELFFNERHVDELDKLLYNKIGYDTLSLMIPGLFTSPYSITSIREYFANGMEDYLLGDSEYLKQISPALYNKIDNLINELS